MKKKIDDAYLLEYLDGTLDRNETQVLEQELQENQVIRERLNLIRFTIRAIKFKAYKSEVLKIQHDFLQDRIENKTFTAFSTPEMEPKARPMKYWFKVAASFLLLFSLGYVLFLLQRDGEQLFENNYISYEIAIERGAGEQEIHLESLYINGEFFQMFQIVSEEQRKKDYGPLELLLLGTAALELNKPEEALRYLQKLEGTNTQNQTKAYQDEADFYLALTFLKLDAYGQALWYVKKIRSNPNHKFHDSFSRGEAFSIQLQRIR